MPRRRATLSRSFWNIGALSEDDLGAVEGELRGVVDVARSTPLDLRHVFECHRAPSSLAAEAVDLSEHGLPLVEDPRGLGPPRSALHELGSLRPLLRCRIENLLEMAHEGEPLREPLCGCHLGSTRFGGQGSRYTG